MFNSRWLNRGFVVLAWALLGGCAAVGVPSSKDPDQMLINAGHLIDQGRPLPAERLIHEAIAILKERDDPHNLGYAYSLYAELLQSNAVNKAEVPYMRHGFRDKTVTLSNRFDKSAEYTQLAMRQYEHAITRHNLTEKYDALTNAHLHLAWLHQRLLQKDAACENFQKTLNAHALNLQKNPKVRPQAPADSTGRCNAFAEHLSGRMEAERFARPLV